MLPYSGTDDAYYGVIYPQISYGVLFGVGGGAAQSQNFPIFPNFKKEQSERFPNSEVESRLDQLSKFQIVDLALSLDFKTFWNMSLLKLKCVIIRGCEIFTRIIY